MVMVFLTVFLLLGGGVMKGVVVLPSGTIPPLPPAVGGGVS